MRHTNKKHTARQIGCVVMASGEGKRFGGQKLLASLAGVAVLERTLACIPTSLMDTVVVTRCEEVAALCSRLGFAAVLHDSPFKNDTVRCGLEVLKSHAACLFLQGDQPLISHASMEALAEKSRLYPASVVRLSWNGEPASPIIFPARFFDELCSINGDRSGCALLSVHPSLMQKVQLVEAQNEWELWDVDTRDNLEQLARVIERENIRKLT